MNWFCVRRTGGGQYKKIEDCGHRDSRPVLLCVWSKSNAPDRIAGCRFWRFLIFPPPSYHTTIIHSSTLWWGELGKVFAENSGLDSERDLFTAEKEAKKDERFPHVSVDVLSMCVCVLQFQSILTVCPGSRGLGYDSGFPSLISSLSVRFRSWLTIIGKQWSSCSLSPDLPLSWVSLGVSPTNGSKSSNRNKRANVSANRLEMEMDERWKIGEPQRFDAVQVLLSWAEMFAVSMDTDTHTNGPLDTIWVHTFFRLSIHLLIYIWLTVVPRPTCVPLLLSLCVLPSVINGYASRFFPLVLSFLLIPSFLSDRNTPFSDSGVGLSPFGLVMPCQANTSEERAVCVCVRFVI